MEPVWDILSRRIQAILDDEGIPGGAVALAQDDRILFARGFGWRDREAGLPADASTVFGIASVTKSFTAAAVARLQEDGKLHVDDPVGAHLPEWDLPDPAWRDRVTLRHLLTHTSGLPPLGVRRGVTMTDPEGPPTLPAPPDVAGILRYLREQPIRPLATPGQVLSYCNEGFALLGAVVARAAGMPFEEYVLTRLVRPLGMSRTTFHEEDLRAWTDVTRLYERVKGETTPVEAWPRWGPYAASGALRSTVLDLLRWARLFLAPERTGVLSPASVRMLLTPAVEYLPGRHYACGWTVQRRHGYTVVGHGGNQRGINAYLAFIPEHGLAAAVLLNVGGGPAEEIGHLLLRAALGLGEEEDPAAEGTADPPAHPRADYLGTYRSAEGAVVRVGPDERGDGLVAVFEEGWSPLRFTAPDLAWARLRTRRLPLWFLRDGRGDVWAVRHQLRVLQRIDREG